MAAEPEVKLTFGEGCPDCGERQVALPAALPAVGDDFDWDVRDYDGVRRFMMEELAARFPERARWRPADVEVTLVELLAFMLDQLSDTLDRVTSEAFLETARRPESVRRLLKLIGFDPLLLAKADGEAPFDVPRASGDPRSDEERFDQYWLDNPSKMDAARQRGPREIHTQHRMVSVDDYGLRLEEHPLVKRAHAWEEWGGSWTVLRVAVIDVGGRELDEAGPYTDDLWRQIEDFHEERGLPLPPRASAPTIRSVLTPYVEDYRMSGQEVLLEDALEIAIYFSLSIQVNANYFQSEVEREVRRVLGTGAGGFFEPGRLAFGEDLFAGDLFQALVSLDGVDNVCLNRFKRLGDRYPDQADSGRIVLNGIEVAVCENLPGRRDRGYYTLRFHGGRKG